MPPTNAAPFDRAATARPRARTEQRYDAAVRRSDRGSTSACAPTSVPKGRVHRTSIGVRKRFATSATISVTLARIPPG
jgi:hypothetical protein